ncbi:hypothetical protein RvY_08429 [Ramazzottius varieornatus]|uniref:DDE-1 domain-containing protein n=1 Tax=Ramazzottius varieornatus TaxID=947166 RepID=A0A1D1V836_RAMVA|nr:hypothetical protein RvY_08429 [Ramazzottius varieornatus]
MNRIFNPTTNDHDKLLKALIKDFLDIHINQGGSPILAIEDDLQYELQISMPTFEEVEKSVAEHNLLTGHREADFEPTTNDRLGEPDSSATEPSSHELFVPRIPDPKVPSSQAADLDYKKRAGRLSEPFVVNIPQRINLRFRYYGICDRKITKFVTEKHLHEESNRKKSADECVALVRLRFQEYELDCLWNADQSGFEYEMRPGRTSDLVGAKHVLAFTRSENSMTHGYTVMMCVSPGARKYLPVLLITPQEDKGVFGPKRTMFRASNLHVTASRSRKMTKELFVEWCEKVFFPQMDGYCLFLAASWPTFADQEAVEEVKPEKLEYEMITIPPKGTGQIQPLDVLCFRMYKGYFRKVLNWIFLYDQPVQVHHRDVILKLR